MPLGSILPEIRKAQAGGYALPCFDTFDMHGTLGIFDALEAKRAPAMVGLYSGLFDRPHPRAFTDYVRAMAQEATVPVSIILDHGASFEHCMQALHVGFTDLMYDGSKLPLEENIARTREIVRVAHAVGAAVEGELGHVGVGRTYQAFGAQGKGFTDPETVVRFVEETGVDLLAIAIGTAHGLYDGEPRLNMDLLGEIRERVEIPLVLHGGSGLSDEQFRAVVAGGISKVNVFTALSVEARDRMLAHAASEDVSMFSMTAQIREAFRDQCAHYIDVFGAAGRA
jgi:fructose-bisphosphate aldolase class II